MYPDLSLSGLTIGLLMLVIVVAGVYVGAPALFVATALRVARRLCRFATRSVRVGQIDWPYLEGGPANAETLVLIHGFCGEKDNWPAYARALTRQYRVIIPDLPGFGQNTRDPSLSYGVADQVEHLHGFLCALAIERCHLGGNSMGGFIAMRYALKYPQRVQTLAIFNGAGVTSRSKSDLELAVEKGENPFDVTTMADVDRFIDFAMHKKIWMPRVFKRVALRQFRDSRKFHNRLFGELTDDITMRPVDDDLVRIAAPTLIVWGRFDRLVDVSCAEVMAAAIPDNRLVILDDVGHVPMMEAPGRTAGHHLSFLRGATYARAGRD